MRAVLLAFLASLSPSLAAVVVTHRAAAHPAGVTIDLEKRSRLLDEWGVVDTSALTTQRAQMYRQVHFPVFLKFL